MRLMRDSSCVAMASGEKSLFGLGSRRKWLNASLPRTSIAESPAAIVWRSALPRTANGKFDRVLLAAEAGQTLRGLA